MTTSGSPAEPTKPMLVWSCKHCGVASEVHSLTDRTCPACGDGKLIGPFVLVLPPEAE